MQIKNKRLFLKYALPCASVLVKRGWVSQKEADKLEKMILENKDIDVDLGDIFMVATSMCGLLARKMNKSEIDDEVIRSYFWYYHDEVVDERFKQIGDFDPVLCRTYPAKVLSISEYEIKVKTPRGEVVCHKSFEDVKPEEFVIIHYDYIIERIDEQTAKDLWKRK
jgi:hydrogenase maturation factor